MLQAPDGHAVRVSGVVWRVDTDGMAVMFLKSIPVQFTAVKRMPEGGRPVWR